MNIPCPIPCITCDPAPPGADGLGLAPQDPSNPFVNLSSERPDLDLFIGRKYGFGVPPLGSTWYSVGCVSWCLSTTSQDDADICAENQEIFCQSVNWPIPNPIPGGIPSLITRPVFQSAAAFCTFTCPDGNSFVFNVPAGLFFAFSQAAADARATQYACSRAAANRLCFGTMQNSRCCLNGSMAASVGVSSNNTPINFEIVSGGVPPGTSIVQSSQLSVVVTGQPTQAGDYPIRIRARDRFGNTMEKNFTITVFGLITASPLPDATIGDQYAAQLNYAGTAQGDVTITIVGGVLPNGLFMDSTGFITGNPTEDGAFQITARLSDGVLSCEKVFDVFVESGACDFFDDIVWDAVITTGNGVGGGSASGSASGNSATLSFATTQNGDVVDVHITGSVSYQGPAIQCRFRVDGSNYHNDFSGIGGITEIYQDGNPITAFIDSGSPTPDTFFQNFDVNIADSPVPSVITIDFFVGAQWAAPNLGPSSLTEVFTMGNPP